VDLRDLAERPRSLLTHCWQSVSNRSRVGDHVE
jgi:hypothetical protein